MTNAIAIDFRKATCLKSKSSQLKKSDGIFTPQGEYDPRRGLSFPLTAGGFSYHSGRYINDACGHLEIVFSLREKPTQAPLIQAWGQYTPLVALTGEGIEATHVGLIRVAWQLDTEYRLRFDWDHRAGATLSVKVRGGQEQVRQRRVCWQAFRQQFLPFSVGGMATAPRFSAWNGSFAGWVKTLILDSVPRQTPGPAAIAADGSQQKAPFPAARGITLLELHDPPLCPDPLKLDQLPDRLADLKKTRTTCKLDELTAHCRSELEIFSMLTWHLAHLWPHCNYWPWKAKEQREIFWKRGHELLPEIAAGQAGGMCGGYAHMMEEVFWAMGFDARRIQARGHSSFEAYSNQLDRWIICDASHNQTCHIMGGPDGQPVGAREIIRGHEALNSHPGALDGFQPLFCDHENLSTRSERANTNYRHKHVRPYDHIGLAVNKTAQYGRAHATDRGDHAHAWYYLDCDRASFASVNSMGKTNILIEDLDQLYPSRNRAAVSMRWDKPGTSLALALKPVGTTFFDRFEIEVDGKARALKAKTLVWELHPGVNQLVVRTVNRLGARGHPFRVALHRRPA